MYRSSVLIIKKFPKITVIENKMGVDEMVKVRDISICSTREHHLVTIDGLATVGSFAAQCKVIGLPRSTASSSSAKPPRCRSG